MDRKEEYSNYINSLPDILNETGVFDIKTENYEQYILRKLSGEILPTEENETNKSLTTAYILENIACDLYINSPAEDKEEIKSLFAKSFVIRRNIAEGPFVNDLDFLFSLSVSALGTEKNSELRLFLNECHIGSSLDDNWPALARFHVLRSFLLMCRKSNGWKDVMEAAKSIDNLKSLQKEFEYKYLNKIKDFDEKDKYIQIGHLIALYNLARIVEISANYLINGGSTNPNVSLKRHYDKACEALLSQNEDNNADNHFLNMVFVGCDLLVKNSIWYSTRTLGKKSRDFINELTAQNNIKPLIELWPSQQLAMQASIFDPAKISFVLQMPTSAGKTLMAEFAIIQSHALNPDSVVVYVVPTRALVNQVTLQLRRHFNNLKLVTEAAVPIFELDPTEDELLRKKCHVLVSTPEKIELLVRTNHPIVKNVSLIVVDEAHNIADSSRGSTFELLLGNISRERPNTRFLLMSPFIPNFEQIGIWLASGDKSRTASVDINWKPSEQIITAAMYMGKGDDKHINLITLPSVHNQEIKNKREITIPTVIINKNNTKKNVAISTAISLSKYGNVLMLCDGRDKTIECGKELMNFMSADIEEDNLFVNTVNYLKEELGYNHILPKMLRKGVAIHHAGLSQEARFLIERLVENNKIRIVCATTTLAQGVNFPIKSVVIESIYQYNPTKGKVEMPCRDFWNIAGRAGRAMEDHMGIVSFVATNKKDLEKYENYLKKESDYLLSSIKNDLDRISEVGFKLNMQFVANFPALARFFQYLLHAVVVSDYKTVSSEVEDTLRSSLVYHQVEQNEPHLAKKLINLARTYLEDIGVKNKNFLSLIDGTGFSSVTIDYLFSQRDRFSDVKLWNSKDFFSNNNQSLDEVIKTIAGIPELDLGRYEKGQLNTKEISNIIKGWVNGFSMEDISNNYFNLIDDPDARVLKASKYIHATLVGQISWGISALQKISLFGKKEADWKNIGHIPALIYYGVSSREAALLRMVGVPRRSADKLASKYLESFAKKSPTFQDVRDWLASVKNVDWEDKGKKVSLTGKQAKEIWKTLNGIEDS